MDFTTSIRRQRLKSFMKDFETEFMQLDNDGDYKYATSVDMFNTDILSQGIEGVVFKGKFKRPIHFTYNVAIKKVDLVSIKKTKIISQQTINLLPQNLYRLFLTEKSFNNPSLTEIITHYLTNQLILQKICPHFSMNYYWDYKDSSLTTYNEMANNQDFHSWAKQHHSIDVWYNALFQIMVGLIALKRYFNMTHTDLHTQNILVQRVPPGGYWTYIINGVKYYVPNLGFVFLIHDFGFAWIPNKLYIKWHYKDTLKYVTKVGREFYDLAIILKNIFRVQEYKVPTLFFETIRKHFHKEEISYIFSRQYYKQYNDKKYDSYPKINTSYEGLNTTLEDKLYWMFYKSSEPSLNYSKKNSKLEHRVESYSLDKYLNKDKFPRNLKQLVLE